MVKWTKSIKMRSGRDSMIALGGTTPGTGDFYDVFDEYVLKTEAEALIAKLIGERKGGRPPIVATLRAVMDDRNWPQKAVGHLKEPAQIAWHESEAMGGWPCVGCAHLAERNTPDTSQWPEVCRQCKTAQSNFEPSE